MTRTTITAVSGLLGLLVLGHLAACSDDTTPPTPDTHKLVDAYVADLAADTSVDVKVSPDGTQASDKGAPGPDAAKSCTTIRADYASAVAAAKKCAPTLPVVQCVSVVTKDLACGCVTAVSSTNATEYALIVGLQATWKALGCDQQPWSCPKIPCQSVSTGKCDSTSSQCVDVP